MPADLKTLKQDLTRRMDGAIETPEEGIHRPPHRPRQSGAARAGPRRGLWQQPAAEPDGQCLRRRPGLLSVQVWDKSLVKAVEIAIRDSGLGLNPQTEGQVIRVPLPPLTQERRNDLVKTAHKYAEGAKVAVRGVRRDGMEQIKAQEKDKKRRSARTRPRTGRMRSRS